MTGTAFLDIETTGLVPGVHEPWEVGLICPGPEGGGYYIEHRWFLPANVHNADPVALQIGGYHDRHPNGNTRPGQVATKTELPRPAAARANGVAHDHGLTSWEQAAKQIGHHTHGLHLAGAVVSFDADMIGRMLRANGVTPSWHYHLIDVEALAVGAIRTRAERMLTEHPESRTDGEPDPPERAAAAEWTRKTRPPWDSNEISKIVGVDPGRFERHTALGDCRWARAIYETVMGGGW